MEVAAAAGPLALHLFRAVDADPGFASWAATLSSVVVGALYVCSVLVPGSLQGLFALNICAIAVTSFQYAAAANAIAASAPPARQGLVFALNTFAALGIITVAQAICASRDATVSTFYYVAASLDFAVVPLMLVLLLLSAVLLGERRRSGGGSAALAV